MMTSGICQRLNKFLELPQTSVRLRGNMARQSRWAIGLLLAAASSPALAQSAAEDVWQPIIWSLQACVRSNTPLARAAGIHSAGDAVSFFFRLCEKSLQEDIDKTNEGAVAVAPGRIRIAIEEQWLKFRFRYKETPPIFY
jgi:hypothetical protein